MNGGQAKMRNSRENAVQVLRSLKWLQTGIQKMPAKQMLPPRKIFLDHHDAWQYTWCNIC